jgi:hypothetical protein
MRQLSAVLLIAILGLPAAPAFAAAKAKAPAQGGTGTLTGTAQGGGGQTLANYTVRLRDVGTGNLVGMTTSGAAGTFTFTGLSPANYVVEIVDAAGNIVGTSAGIAIVAGGTVSVTITASVAAALTGAAAGGLSTALIITTAAVGAGIVGIVVIANQNNASPSR